MKSGNPQTYSSLPPFFTTELFIPQYREGRTGFWEIKAAGICHDHGYHTGVWLVKNLPVLIKHFEDNSKAPQTWMSLTPHEIESQELACRYARGHTVVAGLGLGWAAINIALNPMVSTVTVLECDPSVISLIHSIGVLENLPGNASEKIRIVEANALLWKPSFDIDFLHADIWQSMTEPQALKDVLQMQRNIQAKRLYFWGQELYLLDINGEFDERHAKTSNSRAPRLATEQLNLPLLIPRDMDYALMVQKVVQNRLNRGLPLLPSMR